MPRGQVPDRSVGNQVHPNPFTDEFILTFNGKFEIEIEFEIVTSYGQIVLSRTEDFKGDALRIDATALPAGTYLLKIKTQERVIVKTVIKQ